MPTRSAVLPWPAGGIVRRGSFQQSPPTTTPDAINVRTVDSILGRERGGSRPGIAKVYEQSLGGEIRMMQTVRFVQNNQVKSRLAVIAGGAFYIEDDRGGFTSVSSPVTLGSWSQIQSVDFSGKLYIANTGRGAVTGDWVTGPDLAMGGTPWPDGVIRPLYSGNSTTTEITTRLSLDGPPLEFDPTTNTIAAVTATAGTIPSGCQIISNYAGRLVLAGDPVSPTQWYMSKVLDVTDWDYSVGNSDSAVSATSSSSAGVIGSPITAFIPHTDLCATIACRTSLWFLRGDPVTGSMDNVSTEIGIVDKNAWCRTPDGWLVFLSHDGVYTIGANCAARLPESISREFIPEELIGVNPNQYSVSMQYDVRERGIHLFLSSNDTETIDSQHWWIDWRGKNKSFWKCSLPTSIDPMSSVHRRDISTTGSQVFLGCRDGYIRVFDRDTEDDDGSTFNGYCWMGPILPGGEDGTGKIVSVCGILAENSADVKWELHVGDSAEHAFGNTACASGVFTYFASRMGIKQRVSISGKAAYLKLLPVAAGSEWALEQVVIEFDQTGCQGGC